MQSRATTVEQYLSELPEDRRTAIATVHKVFVDNLDDGFAVGMSYGMIGYCVPHSRYPAGYHCNPAQPLPFGGLASQKGHMSLYLFGLYMDQVGGKRGPLLTWFEEAWKKAGKKLDMGKSCVRFKKLDDLALDVLGQAVRRMKCDEFIATYERGLDPRTLEKHKAQGAQPSKAAAPKKAPAKPAKKVSAKKSVPAKKKTAR